MRSTPVAEQTATIGAILDASGRTGRAVRLRRLFVQQGLQRSPRPGPLKAIVQRHDETALDLYLLLVAGASSAPWDVTRDSRVWARAVGHGGDVDGGKSVVSKAWRRLDETYHLVQRERSGRLARVTLLSESGDRTPYSSPDREFFKLPFAYWTDEAAWYRMMSLPAKATLLISLSLKQPFSLPAERAERWYGLSADTIDRGQRELRNLGVLDRRFKVVNDWLSATGKRTDYTFRLEPPFRTTRARRGHLAAVGE